MKIKRIKTATLLSLLLSAFIILFSPIQGINQKNTSINKIVQYDVRAYSWSNKTRGYYEVKGTRLTEMKLDSRNKLIESIVYTKGKKVYEKNIFTYIQGKRTLKQSYDSKNKIMTSSKYIYKGSGLQEKIYDKNNNLLWYYTYFSNPNGTVKEKQMHNKSSKLIQKTKYYYNESNDLIARVISMADGTDIHLSQYEYEKIDSNGEWTVRKEYQSYSDVYNAPKEIIYRKTSYLKGKRASYKKKNSNNNSSRYKSPSLSVNNLLKMTSFRSRVKNSGGKVLANALRKIKAKTIIRGSCYDWINLVYNENGYKGKKRGKIFWSKESGPYADASLLQPGDWIMFKNQTYGEIGHSGIFLAWLDYEKRSAMVIGYAGQKRTMPGRFREYEITRLFGILRGKD